MPVRGAPPRQVRLRLRAKKRPSQLELQCVFRKKLGHRQRHLGSQSCGEPGRSLQSHEAKSQEVGVQGTVGNLSYINFLIHPSAKVMDRCDRVTAESHQNHNYNAFSRL